MSTDYNDMTFEEAKDVINNSKHIQICDEMGECAINLVSIACDKQVDEQVRDDSSSKWNRRCCPDCDATMEIYYDYCPYCGKKINWYGKKGMKRNSRGYVLS